MGEYSDFIRKIVLTTIIIKLKVYQENISFDIFYIFKLKNSLNKNQIFSFGTCYVPWEKLPSICHFGNILWEKTQNIFLSQNN